MWSIASLTYCGFNFDGHSDIDRRDVEMLLQSRNQGLKPNGVDYLFQPMQTGWQVSGLTPMGARAVCTVAKGLKIIPNRLDVTLTIGDKDFSEDTDFNSVVGKLVAWFKVNKPKINISELLPLSGDRKILFGSKNSRWCLWVAERVDFTEQKAPANLEITWTTRNENCKALWDYFVVCGTDRDFEYYSKEAFAACTNSILGQDFFDLGLPSQPYLHKDKPASEQKDWYAYLSTVAKKMVKHYLDEPSASCEKDMTFLTRQIEAQLDKIEQQVL
jgi:hypothetical protein